MMHVGLVEKLAVAADKGDRQTDRHFIRRILMYIIIKNGLQYNAHDSCYSKNRTKDKGNKKETNVAMMM